MTGKVRWLATALCVVALVLVAPAASGQEDGDGAVLLILDASGSMNATDDSGVRLIDGAQAALERLVQVLPEGAPVGLRVYGHRVPNTDKANGCLDTELIVPVGPLEPGSMIDAIGSFSAKGFTPIGLSLQEAASDLSGGRGTIILVSDGEDTCAPPDPCDVAAELVADGIDVRVHTVGFFLGEDSPAREQLQCIAETTGASYRDVDAIDSLTGELGQIVQQSGIGIGYFHVPLQGSVVRLDAPLLSLPPAPEGGPNGARLGTYQAMLSPGQTMWYAVDLGEPSLLQFGGGLGSLAFGALPGDMVNAVIVDDTGAEVQLWDSRWGRSSVALDGLVDPDRANFGASTGVGFDNLWDEELEGDDDLRMMVEVLGYDQESYDAAVREIMRRPSPPRAGPGTYYLGITWTAAAETEPRPFDFAVSTWSQAGSIHLPYSPVAGGNDVVEAARLSMGGYARGDIPPGPEDGARQGGFVDDIVRGSTVWYSVTLEWDEAVSVRAFLNRPDGASATDGEIFTVEIFDPEMRLDIEPWSGLDSSMALDDSTALDTTFLPRGLAPRPLVGGAIASLAVERGTTGGLHLIAFTWEGAADGTTAEVEFVVNMFGGLEAIDPPPDTQPPSSAEPGEEAAAPDPEGSDDSGPDRGREMVVNVVVLGAFLAVGALVWRWRRRRRSSSAPD